MRYVLLLTFILFSCKPDAKKTETQFMTVFELSEGLETATYHETISFYKKLAKNYPEITIKEIGITDSGEPLHLVTFNSNATGDNFEDLRKENTIALINNGIHPGESDGIDATMMLYRDLTSQKLNRPKHTIITTIPVYNIGGCLNRNSDTRTNQNGPLEYGFRGNARNYDLNRDFIKNDTKNAKTFAKLYHTIKPDVFVDNHTSNGADYQYTLTHLYTQHNKLGGSLGRLFHNTFIPELENNLKKDNWDVSPYVNVYGRPPDNGFSQMNDLPRYSTGYTTLFHSLGIMVETHMLKPYNKRVESNYASLKNIINLTDAHSSTIIKNRKKQQHYWTIGDYYPISWEVDTTKHTILKFKGYKANKVISKLTGAQRIKYDRSKPFTKPVKFLNYYKPSDSVIVPKAYIIKKGYHDIIDLLTINNIEMTILKNDSIIDVESYRIKSYKTRTNPYEGHYLHYDTDVTSTISPVNFKAGDVMVSTKQYGIRYLLETLEPKAPDSFFNWNFFDAILQQKEGFSAYVWEDKAEELLNTNSNLKEKFENKKNTDAAFAKNWYSQLDWIYKQSKYYEKSHMQYPIYRVH